MLALDTLQIISLPVLVPAVAAVTAVCIAHELGKQQRLYEVKSEVLRELVGRRANFEDPGFKIALNSIPVVFHDNEDVKTAWKEYHDTVTELEEQQLKLQGLAGLPQIEELTNLANKKFIILALAICKSLNIKAKENDVLLVFK